MRRGLAPRRASARLIGTPKRALDFEALIGRYGTLALASLTILLGAGAFLSWAIANSKIGPELRVILGALGAAVVGAVGWRLRTRGSMRFGNTLLALALALVHVDAWGAGPYLGLVSSPVALSIAAARSRARPAGGAVRHDTTSTRRPTRRRSVRSRRRSVWSRRTSAAAPRWRAAL